MPLGQPDFLTRVLQRHFLCHQQAGRGAFDQTDGPRRGAPPLVKLLFFLVGQFHDQRGFSTAPSSRKEFRQGRERPRV
jgi:hypothetical protein